MTKEQRDFRILGAVLKTIDLVGFDALKRTSLFSSNHRRVQVENKKAA